MTTLTLTGWTGPWPEDDKDANLKADIAAHAHLDPLSTITNLSNNVDVPVGAIVHYVLCRWASEGSSALLELGPRMVRRLQEPSRRPKSPIPTRLVSLRTSRSGRWWRG